MPSISNRNVLILYGSQTGSAEDVAKRIGRHAKRYHFVSQVLPFDDYKIGNLLKDSLAIFVCSTTGQGEEPDNMKSFWKFILRRNLPENSLTHLHYVVVGLGDSSYIKYNFIAKKLFKRILQLGGSPILPLALGDDQHELGSDATIDPCINNLLEKLLEMHPLPNGLRIVSENVISPPQYKVIFHSEHIQNNHDDNVFQSSKATPYLAEVLRNERITSSTHFQDVRLIRFLVDGVDYEPGDIAVIQPSNTTENVDAFLALLTVPGNYVFSLIPADENIHLPPNFPKLCTVRDCVQFYWDIMSVPKRSFFELLRFFSHSETEKEKLEEFCTPAGQEELFSYCNRPRRSILEVLQDFPETTPHIPFEYFFDLLPPIRTRFFSIASSLTAHPSEVHLLVAVVKYKTRLQKERHGLCSTWLSTLNSGEKLFIGLRRGTMKLSPSTVPAVMVGPGTGCAPFRAFIQMRIHGGIKENYLFFGCRNKMGDFLCSDEWLAFVDKGCMRLFTAFSRDQEDKV